MNPSDATAMPSVVNEILSGEGMTLADAARLCPASRGAGKVSPTTLTRWITVGAPRYDGTLVRLEAARYGRRWMTTRGAVARFIASLTPITTSTPLPITIASPTPDPKRVKAAMARLDAVGA